MPPKEFSFERDIAPHASNFFREIGRNRNLSTSARHQLQGELLGGVTEIETQRVKLQGERDLGRMRKLRIAEGVGAMEDARARRIREENARAGTLSLKNELQELNASGLTDVEKNTHLTELEILHSDNPDAAAGRLLGVYRSSLTSGERFTAAQKVGFAAGGATAEQIATGDPVAIGAAMGAFREDQAGKARGRKAQEAEDKEDLAVRKHLLTGEMEMAPVVIRKEGQPSYVDKDAAPLWMTDESTIYAQSVVDALGTREDKIEWAQLKNSPSDQARMNLIHRIQKKGLSNGGIRGDRVRSAGEPPSKPEIARDIIGD